MRAEGGSSRSAISCLSVIDGQDALATWRCGYDPSSEAWRGEGDRGIIHRVPPCAEQMGQGGGAQLGTWVRPRVPKPKKSLDASSSLISGGQKIPPAVTSSENRNEHSLAMGWVGVIDWPAGHKEHTNTVFFRIIFWKTAMDVFPILGERYHHKI